jgi:hypothetical protein
MPHLLPPLLALLQPLLLLDARVGKRETITLVRSSGSSGACQIFKTAL